MRSPYLVQRCEFRGGKLIYDSMGSTEFEVGGQGEALREIFAKGIALETLVVTVGGKEVKVYMVAAEGFSFAEYQPHLQKLADNELRPQEPSGFDYAVKQHLGLPMEYRLYEDIDAWFDFPNRVLWTLTSDTRVELVSLLEGTKQAWAKKAAAATA